MALEYYPKMMREIAKAKEGLKDHEALPPPLQRHMDQVRKVWHLLEKQGQQDQVRCIAACVYEALHWVPMREREGYMNYLQQGLKQAWDGLVEEEKAKGPSLIIPAGVKLS